MLFWFPRKFFLVTSHPPQQKAKRQAASFPLGNINAQQRSMIEIYWRGIRFASVPVTGFQKTYKQTNSGMTPKNLLRMRQAQSVYILVIDAISRFSCVLHPRRQAEVEASIKIQAFAVMFAYYIRKHHKLFMQNFKKEIVLKEKRLAFFSQKFRQNQKQEIELKYQKWLKQQIKYHFNDSVSSRKEYINKRYAYQDTCRSPQIAL